MGDFEEIVDLDDGSYGITSVILALLGCVIFYMFLLTALNNQVLQANQTKFQKALTNGLRAYSTTYSTDKVDMQALSEGYLTQEDLKVYNIDTNSIGVNRTLATDYLFNIMETSTDFSQSTLKNSGIYIIDIITRFKTVGLNAVPVYEVSIFKNGNEAYVVSLLCNTLEEVQNLVENTLNVTIDIATNYNSSLLEAQKYKREDSTTGGANKQKTYSTYSTNMAIVTNVPIRTLFGTKLVDVKEIQTYTVVRGEN